MSDAPIVEVRDGVVRYRASALGGCDMALLAARLGYEPINKVPPAMQKVFDAGKAAEKDAYLHLRLNGWSVGEEQAEVELRVTERLRVVGHIDGLAWANEQSVARVLEIKSQGLEEWNAWKGWDTNDLWRKYKWQASAYMAATGMGLVLARVLRDVDIPRVEVSEWGTPWYTQTAIRQRVLKIEAAARAGVLLADCSRSFPCPYFYLHEELDRELVDDGVVDTLARAYVRARRDVVVAEGVRDTARHALREACESDKLETETGVKVTFYTQKNPPRWEGEKLKEFIEGVGRKVGEFQSQGESERVRVTLPEVENAES